MNIPARKDLFSTQSAKVELFQDSFYQRTKEALLDVGNKCVIEHSEIKNWANSLNTNQPKPPPFHENPMDK